MPQSDKRKHDSARSDESRSKVAKKNCATATIAQPTVQSRREPRAVRQRAGDGRHDHDDHRVGDDDPADLRRRIAEQILQKEGQKKVDRRQSAGDQKQDLRCPPLKRRERNIDRIKIGVFALASTRSKKNSATIESDKVRRNIG